MTLFTKILTRAVELKKTIPKVGRKKDVLKIQQSALLKLLRKARNTSFGKEYDFDSIVFSKNPLSEFQKKVPVFDYQKIYDTWWSRLLNNEENVCWPGKVKYFALSSGTSGASSKYIPVTSQMLRSIKRASALHVLTLADYDIPVTFLEKGFLMIGGSTDLRSRGSYFEGDLSGITTGNIPFWFQEFYKPGKEISKEKDWNVKIEKIVENAKQWDIAIICGVPAWIQIVLQKIITRYKVNNIHDIWPNLSVYVSGGVSFEPYRNGFGKLFAKPLIYLDTYLASEGFMAFQARPDTTSMQLILNNGIFFEFVPFTSDNFDEDGELLENPKVLLINEVEEGKEYALLISTNAGTWRYLIGDTIKFTSKEKSEIIITGRTKHFMSLCGEHLSVDNLNKAVTTAANELNILITEFTLTGAPAKEGVFSHKWYVGTNSKIDGATLLKRIDQLLCELNDDYAVERKEALKEISLAVLPLDVFYAWMRKNGKEGGQNKFPRVLKKEKQEDWELFVKSASIQNI